MQILSLTSLTTLMEKAKKYGGTHMKYYKNKITLTHGNALDEGPSITNMPEEERVKASIKMHKGVGKYFAPYSPDEVRLINQSIKNGKSHN